MVTVIPNLYKLNWNYKEMWQSVTDGQTDRHTDRQLFYYNIDLIIYVFSNWSQKSVPKHRLVQ